MATRNKNRDDKFDSYLEELESKYGGKKESATSTTTTTNTTSTTPGASKEEKDAKRSQAFNSYRDELSARYDSSAEVNNTYINTFFKDAQDFLSRSSNSLKNITWQSATADRTEWNKEYDALRGKADKISSFLKENKDSIDSASYKQISSLLDDFKWSSIDAKLAFRNANQHYSQFKTQDEYDTAVRQSGYWQNAQGKDYLAIREDLLNLDPNSEEYKWLKSYAPTILTEDNIDEAITRVDGDVNTLTNVLDSWDYWSDIIDRYNKYGYRDSAFPVPEETILGQIKTQKIFLDRYGSLDGMRSALASSRQELWNLENQKKYGFLEKNDDFKAVSSNVATDLPTGFGAFTADSTYYYINDVDGYRMQVTGQTAMGGRGNPDEKYNYMKQDEIDTYNYLYNKEGKKVAEDYLYSLEDVLGDRAVGYDFENTYKDNTALELLFGINAGLDQFASGIKNLFNTTDDYIPQSATQKLSGMIREDLADDSIPMWYNFKTGKWEDKVFGNSLGQMGYDTITTTTNMAPSILASTAVGLINPTAGAITGNALLGASAAGNAYQQKLNLGYTKEEAKTYGVLVGASEALLQYALGGISALGKNGLTSTVLKNLDAVDNVFARFAKSTGGKLLLSAGSEAIEEGLQSIIEPYIWQAVSGETATVDMQEALYSALLGAVSGGLFEGVGLGAGKYRESKAAESIGRSMIGVDGGAKALERLSQEVAGATTGRTQKNLLGQIGKVSTKIEKGDNSGRTARQVAKLYESVKSAIGTQNHADIVKSLTRGENAFSTKEANKIAGALIAYSNGMELTKGQTELLESLADNPKVQQAINGIVYNQKSTMGQRNQQLRDFNRDINAGTVAKATGMSVDDVKAAMEGKPTTAKEVAVETTYEVADDGTTQDYNGNAINIVGVESTADGKLILKTDNGTINSKEVLYANDDEAIIYEAVANLNASPETAWTLIEGWNKSSGITAPMYASNIKLAYTSGKYNYKAGIANLTNMDEVFEAGRADAEATLKETKQASTESIVSNKNAKKKVIFDGFTYNEKKANPMQRASMDAIEVINKLSNLEVHVFESVARKDGRFAVVNGVERRAPNGYFTEGNKIYIDINAGADGKGAMLYTMSHEMGHYIAKWNAQDFKAISDFLFEHYGDGVNIVGLIDAKKETVKKSRETDGKPIPNDAELERIAHEEVVCDMLSEMMADQYAYDKLMELKQKDLNLFQKLGKAIKALLDKIANALGVYNGETPDFILAANKNNFGEEAFRQLQDLYIKAFVQADANYASVANDAEALAEAGIGFDEDTQTVYALRDSLAMNEILSVGRKKFNADAIAQLVAKATDRSIEDARKWVESELTIANLVMANPEFLDFEPDERYDAIKKNSDYPQGTVDLSNLCPKREEFTAMFDKLQKEYPNKLFTAQDIADMRKILSDANITVACGACFVEDRRQLIGEIADTFIGMWTEAVESGKPLQKTNASGVKADLLVTKELAKKYNLTPGTKIMATDTYIPNQYDLTTYEGFKKLEKNHPMIAMSFNRYNNSRGQQSARLIEGRAEYKRQILGWSAAQVRRVNNNGGLRIFSFSDFEVVHLLDLAQVIIDCSAKGVKIQGYTKIPSFAKLVRDTGIKLNRSLIPEGDLGYHIENGKVVLDYDATEGIDINDENFLDERDNPNVGNIVIGINPTQIGAAMLDSFIDYIIPFHSNKAKAILKKLGTGEWVNYKESQHEKDVSTGTASKHNVNIYTEVINKYNPTNKVEFVNAFLDECKSQGKVPRYPEFLNKEYKEDGAYTDEYGTYDYTYREGYHKLIVDFKMFDKDGNILPQGNITPNLDDGFMTELLNAEIDKKQNYEFPQEVYDAIDKRFGELTTTKMSERDTAYLAAVNRGDMETAHRMVDEAANEAGYTLKGYHGTRRGGFTVFKNRLPGTIEGVKSIFLAKDEGTAGQYAYGANRKIYTLYAKMENPLVVDCGYSEATSIYTGNKPEIRELARKYLRDAWETFSPTDNLTTDQIGYLALRSGQYDGVIFKNVNDSYSNRRVTDVYEVFEPEQVKSADPVTYDDNGNVIPLSERFNTEKDDIRYSDRDSDGKVLTKEQQEFFKNSMVRDADGNLLPVYHSTSEEFNTFEVSNSSITGEFYYFAVSKTWSKKFHQEERYSDPKYIKKCYLNLTNVFDLRVMPEYTAYGSGGYYGNEWIKHIEDKGVKLDSRFTEMWSTPQKNQHRAFGGVPAWALIRYDGFTGLRESLIAAGYDGIVYYDKARGRVDNTVYVAFHQNQIKLTSNKNPTTDPDIRYQDRTEDSVSNRSLLANAFEGIAKPEELKKLKEYKDKLSVINAEENKLRELNSQIKELSFAKGKRDMAKLRDLRDEATKTANRISTYDAQLLRLEASKPLQDVLSREKKTAYQMAEQKSREALEAYKAKTEVKQSEFLREYRETKAALKNQKNETAIMEKEFIRIAKAYEKLDAKSTAKGEKDTKTIADLKSALKEEAKKHRNDQKAWETEFNRLMREYEYADRNISRLEDKIQKQRETARNKVESHGKTVMRNKIRSVVGELNELLLNEDKKHHVPDSLKKAVASALAFVNMDNLGVEKRVAEINRRLEELYRKKEELDRFPNREMEQDSIQADIDAQISLLDRYTKMGDKLNKLREAYDDIQNSTDPDIANAYDPVIAGSLRELSQTIGDTALVDMSIEQLSDVYDMYKMVLTRVRDANKSLIESIKESISNRASRVVGEVKSVGGEHKYRASILDPVRTFFWNNLKPVYAMENIGSETMTEAYNQVRKGEDTWAKDVNEARAYFLDKSKKYGYDSWDFDKKYAFESASGLEFELTLEQILSLYAYSKREQAHDHLRLGGFVFDSNIETHKETVEAIEEETDENGTVKKKKVKRSFLKYKVNTGDAHQITPEILADIIGTLSTDQMGFVDEMQDYLSTVMGAKGNEVTMKMYGVKLFKEKFYFPLKSAKQFMFEQNEVAGEVRIKNSGFTNKVVAKANNPVILNNFMDVWANHVNDMSMYHSFVLPLEDFNRIFNYNSPKQENVRSVSVKGTIQNAYSPAAVNYVKQLITDLNGGARSDPRETFAKSLTAKWKKAKVFSSLSVVIQQPSSIGRAFALVDPKYFHPTVDGMNHDELWAELKKYAPVAVIKEMGYFDVNMGRSTLDFIKAKEYSSFKEKAKAFFVDGDYRDELLSKAPALADELSWCAIWNAVKRETLAKHPGLDIKSEPFLMLAGARFTEVITKTQVYDSILARSANMRSKSGLMSMVTSFLAEPTTSINMLEDALRKRKRGFKGYAGRAFASVAVSVILNNALVALVYGMRDDDEDETFAEKYMQSFVSNMIDDINPLTYLPYLKDMWSLLQGYDIERTDMSLVSDLADGLKGLVQAYSSEDGDVVGAWHDMVGAVANIGGVPLDNIRRDVNGAINFFNTIIEDVNGRATTWGSMGDALEDEVRGSLPVVGWLSGETKADKLYDAIMSGDTAYVNRLKGSYKEEDAYHNAVRKALRENDPRIMEAAKAGFNGDPSERVRIAKLIIADGFAQDDVVAAINAEINKMKPDDSSGTKAKGFYTAEDFAIEIANGDQASANAIKVDVIQTAKKNGKSAEEAEKAFNSSAKSELKDLYMEGKISRDKVINALTSYCGVSRDDAVDSVDGWDFEEDHGFTYGKADDAYKAGKITSAQLKTILINDGGYTAEEADYQIEAYDWEKQGYENVTPAAVKQYKAFCASANVPKDVYLSIRSFANNTENDKDENGKNINYSAMKKIMAEINSHRLTSAQKDAIARSLGWSEKNINKYKPW